MTRLAGSICLQFGGVFAGGMAAGAGFGPEGVVLAVCCYMAAFLLAAWPPGTGPRRRA